MKQRSLAETGFLPKRGKVTRKAEFLAEMRTVVPCSWLEGLIEGVYPKAGRGRRPALLSGMVRIHLPIWTHESPLSWLSQECCGVDALFARSNLWMARRRLLAMTPEGCLSNGKDSN